MINQLCIAKLKIFNKKYIYSPTTLPNELFTLHYDLHLFCNKGFGASQPYGLIIGAERSQMASARMAGAIFFV